MLVLGLLLTACGLTRVDSLNFTVDDRLHFTSPADRATVQQPLTVRWTMHDFTTERPYSGPPRRGAGYFAMFVDQAPIKPGQTMKATVHDDPSCIRAPRCPDASYLAAHQIYLTTATRLVIPAIATIVDNKNKTQIHSLVIVLMDTAGHRIGESAWQLDVRMRNLQE